MAASSTNWCAGPEGMTISKDGIASWSVPADFARVEVTVEIEVTDSIGGQARSTPFRLTLDDRPVRKDPIEVDPQNP